MQEARSGHAGGMEVVAGVRPLAGLSLAIAAVLFTFCVTLTALGSILVVSLHARPACFCTPEAAADHMPPAGH